MRNILKASKTNVNVVVKTEPPKEFFAKNQGIIQFLLFVVTLMTLIASVYFSINSLQISGTQLGQAKTQLALAQEQFDESLKQREIDKKDAHRRDSLQEIRFKSQDSINKRSLQAIELQAKVAKSQFESQVAMNKDIVYQNRPIFSLLKVKLDTARNLVYFSIKNTGKRPATIIQTKIAIYNRKNNLMFMNSPGLENSELNESVEAAFNVRTNLTIHRDPETMYYLHFKYNDLATNQPQDFDRYFRWESVQPNIFSWQELTLAEKLIFIKKAMESRFDLSL